LIDGPLSERRLALLLSRRSPRMFEPFGKKDDLTRAQEM